MKKSKKIALIISLLLIILGFVLSVVSFAMMDFDISNLSTVKDHEIKEYIVEEDFDSVYINVIESDISFALSDDGIARVVTEENEISRYDVRVIDGALRIEFRDDRSWIDYFEIGWGNSKMTVYLPEGVYTRLSIEDVSGDVRLNGHHEFENIKINTTSGDIHISDCTPISLGLSSVSGDIRLYRTECKRLDIDNVSGDTEFELFDAAHAEIESVSGDIEGSLLSNKHFDIDTVSGDVELPRGTKNGEWEIEIVSGDIELEA